MVVVMGAAGDCVRRHLAVHVEVSEARPGGTPPKTNITPSGSGFGKMNGGMDRFTLVFWPAGNLNP